jgi:hypothetical protein
MRKYDLINNISSKNVVPSIKSMQVLAEQSEAYLNFINTLRSESTRQSYRFCLENFLNHYRIDLLSFLKLPQQDITNLVIKYLVDKKVSRQSHLYLMINKEYLAIPEKFEKLIISLRTAQAKEYSLEKEQTSYDDLLDALRLSLKGIISIND